MISPGALVTCRFTGVVLWVVVADAGDGRYHLRGKMTDRRGRAAYTGRVSGEGDLTLIRPAPVYAVGDVIERPGLSGSLDHIVLRDLGDEGVELAVPEDRIPLRGGYTVREAAGNSTLVSKADLLLDALKVKEITRDERRRVQRP
jgi:hypothetical protein